jgi:hypothetical protein
MGVRFFGLVVVSIDTVCLLSCQVRRPDGEELRKKFAKRNIKLRKSVDARISHEGTRNPTPLDDT